MPIPVGGCLVNLSSLLPSCATLTSVAGVRDFFYAASRKDLIFTRAADGTIITATLTTGGKLILVQGRKFQNSGATELAVSGIGKRRFKHKFSARVYFRTQLERNALENLSFVEDLVILSPNNDNQIEVYGQTIGLAASTGKVGTGVKLDDDNTGLFEFDGEEAKMPVLFNTVTTPTTDEADYAANIAVLNLLVNA